MRTYKKLIVFLLFVTICSVSVFAHSGRTDANGGHNSPSGYHYHHGYDAHQHPGGVCPYDFDDKTGWSSGEPSSSSNPSHSYTHNAESVQNNNASSSKNGKNTSTKKSQQRKEASWLQEHVLGIFFWGTIAAIFIVTYARKLILTRRRNKKRQIEWNLKREEFIAFFEGQSARKKANVPEEVVFNSDYWPEDDHKQRFVLNVHSNRFHKTTCRHATGVPIPWYKLPKYSTPCKICNPIRPTHPQWLSDYRKYIRKKIEYNIPDPDIPGSNVQNSQKA